MLEGKKFTVHLIKEICEMFCFEEEDKLATRMDIQTDRRTKQYIKVTLFSFIKA